MLRLFRLLPLVLLAVADRAIAQEPANPARKSVDLNEFVVRQSGVINPRQKSRLQKTSLIIRPRSVGKGNGWDSLILLTRFPAPSSKSMVLHAVSSRLAALDTSKLDLFLVIIQLRSHDTLFCRIPITPDMLDDRERRFEMDLRDSILTLEPSPFYLGFGFHIKPLSEEYRFPFYYTHGGEGAVLSFPQGNWRFISHPRAIYIFPFRIKYVESGS